ncbi:hypothetical protein [Clostridium sp. OS1-26]|uniref:hypothetical protein n=1 Tax=Clostridium sp. OS1-26 TaxID=3070681 RepID=UPI0027E156CA|nr:hypothetical protein [Clostridium sp. OS1-26]WML33920.1 hypothetical protein RCG18_21745 [Clostridium sp. OS1-26]
MDSKEEVHNRISYTKQQFDGLDEFENLEMIDGFTNRRIGQNLEVQMQDIAEGTRIKIIIER